MSFHLLAPNFLQSSKLLRGKNVSSLLPRNMLAPNYFNYKVIFFSILKFRKTLILLLIPNFQETVFRK